MQAQQPQHCTSQMRSVIHSLVETFEIVMVQQEFHFIEKGKAYIVDAVELVARHINLEHEDADHHIDDDRLHRNR